MPKDTIPKHIKISDIGDLRLSGNAKTLSLQLAQIAAYATLGRCPSVQS